MNEEEIEELKDFTIDLTDIDELALGLEVCSKKSNMVIQEFADTIIQLQQENQKYKEVGNTYKKRCQLAIEYIESKEYEYGDEEQDNYIYDIGFDEVNELLDILKGMK